MLNFIRKYKLVFLILIEILLIYLLYILRVTPGASGYEASIYAAYPNTFWAIYFLIYLFSLSAVLYAIFIKSDKLLLYPGLLNIVILSLIILLLPFFRAYFTIDLGNSSAHLVYINDILSTHRQGETNPYPMSNIPSAIIVLFTQIKVETIGQIIPVFYYFIYVVFAWLLAKKLYSNNNKSMLLLLFLLIPILQYQNYYPSLMFFLLVPMLLYAFAKDIKSASNPFRYIIVILICFFPFMHPASSILLMLLFAIICLAWCVIDTKNFTSRLGGYKTTPLIFLVVWFFWTALQSNILAAGINAYLAWISNLQEVSYYKYYTTGWVRAELSMVDTIILWVKIFGPRYLLFAMASIFSVYSVYSWIKKRNRGLRTILSLICLVYIVLDSFSFFITSPLLGKRLYPYSLLLSMLVSADYLLELVNASKTKVKKIASLIFMIILLFSMTYIATFGVLDSPFNKKASSQGTYMYLNSTAWLLQTRNKDFPVEGIGNHLYLFAPWVEGRTKANLEPNLIDAKPRVIIPPHFGYDNESFFAKTFKRDCYFVVDKRTELIQTKVYPEYEYKWSYTPDDYKKLEYDKSLDKIYHNGEIKIFYINGAKWREAE